MVRAGGIWVGLAVSGLCVGWSPSALAQRSLGIDVSAWQGSLSQSNWNAVRNSGRDFAFIRSTRGGTTGFYNQSDPNNTQGLNTLSQRYDDPYFVQNITRATAAGMFAGPYHFGRADIIATTLNANGIPNNGVDEANHMLEIAGAYMKPGYLRPVFDLEAGAAQRSDAELTQFAVDFATTIYNAKGIYPICYINSSYANDEVNSGVTIMDLWIARWPNQANPEDIDVQNIDPPAVAAYPNVYGVWNPSFPSTPSPHPWKFWQYASTGSVPGISGNCDINVANGNIEFVKDFLVPAIWQPNSDGTWTTATNWNSNPGLPGPNDRVIIDRSAGDYLVTLSSGTQSVRSLFTNERVTVAGGTLNIQQYLQSNNTFTQSGGTINAGSLINNSNLTKSGGTFTTGLVTGTGSLNISGGTFTATSIRQNALNVSSTGLTRLTAGSNSTSVVNTLTITGSGKVDLNNNSLVLDYAGASQATAVRSLIASAYNGGIWTGGGLTSGSAATASSTSTKTALGFAEATDLFATFPATFQGQQVDNTSILIRYTLAGDATLNATVDSADFNLLASNFGTSNQRWSRGDFTYNGSIDSADFNVLASNFGKTLASGPGASVPEPATVSLVVAIGILLCRGATRQSSVKSNGGI